MMASFVTFDRTSLIFQVYMGIAMVKYMELTLSWYGGETQMLLEVGEETKVREKKSQVIICDRRTSISESRISSQISCKCP